MKPVNYQTFKMIRRMSLNQFNRWVESIYKSGMKDALDQGSSFTCNELAAFLQTIPGIGKRTIDKIMKAMEERNDRQR
jgi:hypothetical protein